MLFELNICQNILSIKNEENGSSFFICNTNKPGHLLYRLNLIVFSDVLTGVILICFFIKYYKHQIIIF